MDPIECLHELEDLGVEHAINLVKSECVFFFWSSLEPFWDMGAVGGLDCGGDRDLVLLFAPHTPSTFLDSEQHGYAWVLSTAACHCHLRSLRPCASGEVGLFTRVIALPYKSKEAWTNAVLPIPRQNFFLPCYLCPIYDST